MRVVIEASEEESKTPIFKAIQALLGASDEVRVVKTREELAVEKRRAYQRQQYRKRKGKEVVKTVEPEFPVNNILMFQ